MRRHVFNHTPHPTPQTDMSARPDPLLLVVVLELIEHDRGLSRRDEDDGLLGFRLRVPGGLA